MLELCPISSADYADATLFLTEFADETRDRQFWLRRFTFWWESNPAFGSDTQRGWLLRDRGRIVGFFGMVASRFLLGGQETTVFGTTTWRVLPEYGSQSLKLFFQMISATKHALLFCTTPSKQVVQMLGPLKFLPVPNYYAGLPDAKVPKSVIVIDAREVLRSRTTRLKNDFVMKLVTASLAPVLQTVQHYRLKDAPRRDRLQVWQLERADASFDMLWEKTKHTYRNTNVRTAETVNWYCFACREIEKQLFACYRESQLIGYATFWRKDRPALKMLECVDLWIDQSETDALGALVDFAKHYAREHAVDLVVFPHFTQSLRDCLINLGLLQMHLPRKREYLKTDAQTYGELHGASSYFVGFQGDYGL